MVLTLLDFTVGQVWQCDLENIEGWSEDITDVECYENLLTERGFTLDDILWMISEDDTINHFLLFLIV